MDILNAQAIQKAIQRHKDAATWLTQWIATVRQASWQNLQEVRRIYPSADGIPLKRIVVTVFNVKGNEYRLLTVIRYKAQQVYVVDVLTHAEYSKDKWKDRL